MTELAEPDGVLIYVAKRLRKAKQLEEILTAAGIDYDVAPEEYQAGLIFPAMRIGAFFYVDPEARERAAAVLLENGFAPLKPRLA